MKKHLLTLVFLTPTLGWCDQGGTFTGAFLNLGQGARAEAMGGAFTAIADDARACYWNPAGLAKSKKQKLSLDYLKFVGDINTQYVSYVLPVESMGGSLGLSATYANFGSIDRRDATGASVSGDTKVSAFQGGLSWGQTLGERLLLGAGVKSFSQNLAGTKSSGFAADAGVLMELAPERLTFGASVVNLGPTIEVGTTEEKIPLTYKGGLAYQIMPKKLVVDLDVSKAEATEAKLHLGGEYIYQNQFVIRAGYQDTKEAGGGLSAGAGFIWKASQQKNNDFFKSHKSTSGRQEEPQSIGTEIRFDYAYVDYGDLDSTHRIGIEFAF